MIKFFRLSEHDFAFAKSKLLQSFGEDTGPNV
jgi:hypothetical protein